MGQVIDTNQQGSKPVPDPTVLTTEQLHREIAAATRLMEARIAAAEEANAIRFLNIEREFALVENRRVEQKVDTKTAVDAALQAAKSAVNEQTVAQEKAITKSETAAAEQSKQQYATFNASLKAVTDKVDDLKDRVATIEAIKIGSTEVRSNGQASLAAIVGVVGAIIAILALVMARLP